MKPWRFWMFCVLFTVAIFLAMNWQASPKKPQPSPALNGPGPSVDPNSTAYATTLPMMFNAFKSDPEGAKNLFVSREITVDGRVAHVVTDKEGWTLNIVDTSQPSGPVAGSFRFGPKSSYNAKSLTTGDYVWCTGRYGRVDDGGLIEFYGDDVKVTLPPKSGSWAKSTPTD